MKNWMVLVVIGLTTTFFACNKDDDNGEPGVTNPIQGGNSAEFSQDFQQKTEAFAAILTRNTCGICGQSGHPNFDNYLNSRSDISGVSFNASSSDPLHQPEARTYASILSLRGTPSFTQGFNNFSNNPSRWQSEIANFESNPASAYIAMDGKKTDSGFDVNVKVSVNQAIQNTPHLAVYMLENNVVSPQTDYGARPSLVQDYVHNHVFRGSANAELLGESINDMWIAGDTATKAYSFSPSDDINKANVYFIAVLFEVDNAGNPVGVINSQQLLR